MRLPSFQTASGVKAWRLRALEPIGLLPEVQNGISVLPEKEPLSKNVLIIFGACPCQIG